MSGHSLSSLLELLDFVPLCNIDMQPVHFLCTGVIYFLSLKNYLSKIKNKKVWGHQQDPTDFVDKTVFDLIGRYRYC